MSEGKPSVVRNYRGPAIAVGLGVSLIAAFAIPAYLQPPKVEPVRVELRSDLPGTVEIVPTQVGQTVKKGDVLVQLSDSNLELQLMAAQQEYDQAETAGKTPIVEPGMLGGIGTVRTFVSQPQRIPTTPLPAKEISSVTAPDPKATAALKSAQTSLDAKPAEVEKLTQAMTATQAEKDELAKAQADAQNALADATARQGQAVKDIERMTHLYDIGGVAYKKVNAAKAAKDTADADIVTAQKQIDDLKAKADDLDRRLSEASANILKAKKDLETLSHKVAELDAKAKAAPVVEQAKPTAPPLMAAKRRVYFSTAPIGSTAPVTVKLVESEDPAKQKAVETTHDKLVRLKGLREKLSIEAPFDARIVKILIHKGDQVSKDSIVIVLEPIK